MSVVPVVDLSRPIGEVAASIDQACREVGFWQVVGHGLDPELEHEAWDAARDFFALDLDTKLLSAIPPGAAYGFTPLAGERLAASLGEETPPDLKETFSSGPADIPDEIADDPAAAFVYSTTPWPAALPSMRATWQPYYEELAGLAARIMSAMAVALALPDDHYAGSIEHHTSALRALHYPDLGGRAPSPGQLRAGAHTDYGTLTLLRQDDAPGGLEVLGMDGTWHAVPPVEGAYVVNVADALARWTNDRWRSTLHRVVTPPVDAGRDCTRRSMAFFHNADWDAVIECLPTCVGAGERPRYAPIRAGRHLMDKFRTTQG